MLKERLRKIPVVYLTVPVSILFVIMVASAFTGLWPWKDNPYNSYTLQACAWLEGRLDLGQNYEWLELAIYKGKYFVSFPPFPSYILLPFAAVFGTGTPDNWIALAVVLTGAVFSVRLYQNILKTTKRAEFYVLYLYLASGLLFVSLNGYVWFIAQSMCFTLSIMSLVYATDGKCGLSLALWACAVGCRPMAVLYFPFILLILWKRWKKDFPGGTAVQFARQKRACCIPVALIAFSYMLLNYLRFGSIMEFGHNYLPEFTSIKTGQFNISYLAENLKHLLRLPQTGGENDALIFYTFDGMAFWLLTPFFITAAAAWLYAMLRKRKLCLASLLLLPVLIFGHVIFICLHKTLGGWHFGNRYLLDILPYLYTGFLFWKPDKENFDHCNIPLFFLGLSLNLAGTVAVYNHWI